jgi:hypothetical protein
MGTIILKTSVTGKIGEAANNCETLNNIKRVRMESQADPMPIFVLNTSIPIGFDDPHKLLRGEIVCTSEAWEAFYHNGSGNKAYIVPGGTNLSIPYVVFTAKTRDGATWTYTIVGFDPIDDSMEIDTDKTTVTVYPFKAYYVTKVKT